MNGNKSFEYRRIFLLAFLLCFFFLTSTTAKAQDTLHVVLDTTTKPAIPANELYKNTWSTEHVRLSRLPHTDTTNLELITPETPAFTMPVKNFKVISPYGKRGKRIHTGIDLKQRLKDTIFAAFDGMVRMAKNYSSYGNVIVIRHPNGLETVYSHLSELLVKPYQSVKAGELIGLAGRTGRATTEHLHFEIRFFYEHFNPSLLIDFENQCLRSDRISFIDGELRM